MNTKRRYDRAFKERAVKLSCERCSITELASELGVLLDLIYSWSKEFSEHGSAAFSGHGVERLSDEGCRVKELEKRLKSTELELEILKKRSPFCITSVVLRQSVSKLAFALFPKNFLQNRQAIYAFIECNRGRYTAPDDGERITHFPLDRITITSEASTTCESRSAKHWNA